MDSSKCSPQSVSQNTRSRKRNPIKRPAICEKIICLKKRKEHPKRKADGSSGDEPPQRILRRSPRNNLQISAREIPSRKRSAVNGASTSSNGLHLANGIKTSKILQQSEIIRKAGRFRDEVESNFKPEKSDSVDNIVEHISEMSSLKPGHALRNLFYHDTDDDSILFKNADFVAYYSNLPKDVLTEKETICKNIRHVLEKERKLKNSISQIETLNIHQPLNNVELWNPVNQNNQDYCNWENFLDFWEGEQSISDPTMETHHHKKTAGKPKLRPLVSSASLNTETFIYISYCPPRRRSNSIKFKPNISNTDIPWKAEDLLKNVEINLLEKNQMPPFPKIRIDLPEKPDESLDFKKVTSYAKDIIHFFENDYDDDQPN